jgi:hypothetical protein
MKRLLALIGLCLFAPYALAQNVATCSTAVDGQQWTTVFLPCPAPGVLSYIGPTVPATAIIADMRCGGAACPTSWMLASKVALTTDQVWGLKSSTLAAGNEHWYVPAGILTIGTIPNPPPPPTLPTTGTGTFTVTWPAPTQNTDGSAASVASYNIFQGASAATLAKVANVLAPVLTYLTPALPPGTYYFAVDAVSTTGGESAKSLISSGTVPAACGVAPSTASQTVACPTGTTGSWTQTHGWVAAAYPTCWTAAPWTPTTAPAGACVTTTTPTKLICPVPTVVGPVTCMAQ